MSMEVSMFNKINILGKALDASWKRNEVISNNIANENTPGFKRSNVIFEDILKEHLSSNKLKGTLTNQRHIAIDNISNFKDLKHKVEVENTFSTRRDKNNVDIDVEMAELAKNEIMFNTLSSRVQSSFQKIKSVINEGR